MAEVSAPPVSDLTYCTVHTTVETSLRCNKCNRLMCTKCARRTPVGYRCKECVSNQQTTFYNSQGLDPLIQFAVSFGLGLVGAALAGTLLSALGFFFMFLIGIPVSGFVGGLISDLSHRAAGRRRGKYSWIAVAGGIVISAIVVAAIPTLLMFLTIGQAMADPELLESGGGIPPILYMLGGFTNIGWWVYVVVATATSVGRLRFGK